MAVQPDATTALEALRDLRARLNDALMDGHPPESCGIGTKLAADLVEADGLVTWCRDAAVAWSRMQDRCTWDQLAQATNLSDSTLQSRWKKWYERKADNA